MNCKLGGLPWMIDMPLTNLMTIGYDVCHDPKDKKASWGAVVATMDLKKRNCQFFSAVNRHTNNEVQKNKYESFWIRFFNFSFITASFDLQEMSNFLSANIAKALQKFYEINGTLPSRILFFRDGVGDGQVSLISIFLFCLLRNTNSFFELLTQIAYVYNQELLAIRNKMKDVYMNLGFSDDIKFAYMIVTKKVNTRFFFNQVNFLLLRFEWKWEFSRIVPFIWS